LIVLSPRSLSTEYSVSDLRSSIRYEVGEYTEGLLVVTESMINMSVNKSIVGLHGIDIRYPLWKKKS